MPQINLDDVFNSYLNKKTIFKNKDILSDKYVPDTIPHREEEINQIARILAPSLRGERLSNIFIYGKTGTGKSVCVKYVANELEKKAASVKIIYINCKMKRISDTEYRMLAEITRRLGIEVPATGLPTDEVYKMFFDAIDAQNKNVILILDEIDTLVKKIGDDILYNLTRMNQELKNTKLSIIGISNNLSFTEALDPRVKSSLSEEEIIFTPYNAVQLQNILVQRAKLAFNENIDPGVIAKCAALAAQEHGDARKALDLLRVAGELAERSSAANITPEYIDQAENKLDLDRTATVVRAQPKQSKAVLSAIISLIEKGQENIQTGDIFSVYENICRSQGLKTLTQRRVSDLIGELDMLGIINSKVISKGRYGRTREIGLHLTDSLLRQIKDILADSYMLQKEQS